MPFAPRRSLIAYAWTGPNTALGLMLVGLACATGGRVRLEDGVVEAHGGLLPALLRRLLPPHGAAAVTLGHTVLGCDARSLARYRGHEHEHVAQYERWGPFFLPAYFAGSLAALVRGGHPYRDNPFEVAARAAEHREATRVAAIPEDADDAPARGAFAR
jgi:hypothetical protein